MTTYLVEMASDGVWLTQKDGKLVRLLKVCHGGQSSPTFGGPGTTSSRFTKSRGASELRRVQHPAGDVVLPMSAAIGGFPQREISGQPFVYSRRLHSLTHSLRGLPAVPLRPQQRPSPYQAQQEPRQPAAQAGRLGSSSCGPLSSLFQGKNLGLETFKTILPGRLVMKLGPRGLNLSTPVRGIG